MQPGCWQQRRGLGDGEHAGRVQEGEPEAAALHERRHEPVASHARARGAPLERGCRLSTLDGKE